MLLMIRHFYSGWYIEGEKQEQETEQAPKSQTGLCLSQKIFFFFLLQPNLQSMFNEIAKDKENWILCQLILKPHEMQ